MWARVMAGVRPIRAAPGDVAAPMKSPIARPPAAKPLTATPTAKPFTATRVAAAAPTAPAAHVPAKRAVVARAPRPAHDTLDGRWDRQLSRGLVSPDRTVDLHGHTLSSAHALLDAALDQALRGGDRTILLVTGKPPRPESERPHARGAIRAAVGDWLAGSRHAADIAAVRAAHSRHGGAGALYIVLRKSRAPGKS